MSAIVMVTPQDGVQPHASTLSSPTNAAALVGLLWRLITIHVCLVSDNIHFVLGNTREINTRM
jgi:hypothetical protein